MDIQEIFESMIKIEPKVMAIESLFNNPDRLKKTNYEPAYQRNYVWDDEKATYFIESILLGTEIPPLIYFRNGDKVEVIDGRQRYETILRFIKNEMKLKKNGLQKLQDLKIANKTFKDIGELKDVFWDTKLRIIEFSFHNKSLINEEIEDIVKKEIFKRYNSGITPLKPTDIDRAAYFEDDLNSFLRKRLEDDKVLNDDISTLFHFDIGDMEVLLKKIRQLLVQHKIPIKYYSVKKDIVIAKYYEILSNQLEAADIEVVFNSFIEKINFLLGLKKSFKRKKFVYNRLMFECIFWALSIIEEEGILIKVITPAKTTKLVDYVIENSEVFKMDRSSFSRELLARYTTTAIFFQKEIGIDFNGYIQTTAEFKAKNREAKEKKGSVLTSFDELRINKPEPSSIAIVDILRQMERQRFLIRPPYQRKEVINKKKSSAIIESILLGIKLPPIFVFKRLDGISEVLDGQQRLLSILGFIGKKYLNEKNEFTESAKDNYALSLKDGILKKLNTKQFQQLTDEQKDRINNFDLWIIEINQKNNQNFEQIDLFIRLNSKPYPIKENTFEMWNSYIDRTIIQNIKDVHSRNKDWFYFRKNNDRMEDENIYTFLCYLQYGVNANGLTEKAITKDLDIYKVVDKINLRIKSKIEISKLLEDPDKKKAIISACETLEHEFISKVKVALSDGMESSTSTLNKNLDFIFNIQAQTGRRTQQSFYALWYFMSKTSLSALKNDQKGARGELKKLFVAMTNVKNKDVFDKLIEKFWKKFK